MFYFDPILMVVGLAGMLIAGAAAALVKSRIHAMHNMPNRAGLSGREAALRILQANGITDVRVEAHSGWLTDHYSPSEKVVRLSPEVHDRRSVSALAIAAHEVGHAIQHSTGYPALAIRNMAVPVASIGSSLGLMLIPIGMGLGLLGLAKIGLLLFAGVVFFQIITLPVEFNASRRALQQIETLGLASGDEYVAARKVLTAAALTYVAAAIMALLYLLYYAWRLGLIGGGRR